MEENYLYTVEAIRDYLKCLSPSGILSITVWDRLNPPRNVPKLLASVAEAIRGTYDESPQKRVFAFNLLLSTATILVKKSDFLPQETAILNDYCRRMSFDVDYYPDIPESPKSLEAMLDGYARIYTAGSAVAGKPTGGPEESLRPGDFYRLCLQWFADFRQQELFSRYFFDIRPATDDRPYYAGYIKPRTIPLLLNRLGAISEEWGYLLLLGTLLQSLLFAFVVIALPLLFRRRELLREKGDLVNHPVLRVPGPGLHDGGDLPHPAFRVFPGRPRVCERHHHYRAPCLLGRRQPCQREAGSPSSRRNQVCDQRAPDPHPCLSHRPARFFSGRFLAFLSP